MRRIRVLPNAMVVEQRSPPPSPLLQHNLRGPPKGFRRRYRDRRQTAHAAFTASAEMRRRRVGAVSSNAVSGSRVCYAAARIADLDRLGALVGILVVKFVLRKLVADLNPGGLRSDEDVLLRCHSGI